MNREILNLKNLSVSYGDINILKDICTFKKTVNL